MSSAAIIEQVVVGGDLSKLSPQDRLVYYQRVCASLNLNPLTRPFEYLTLNNRLQLYAKKDCTDQLRRVHRVSLAIVAREVVNNCYVVTARATLPNGRTDESTGAVHIGKLKDEDLANAYMKAECVTLHCESLTRRGFVTYDRLTLGEEVLAYDCERDVTEWVPLENVSVYPEAPIIDLGTPQRTSFLCTPDHSWAVRRSPGYQPDTRGGGSRGPRGPYASRGPERVLMKAHEMKNNHRLILAAPCADAGPSLLSPLEAAVLGWVVTDGTIKRVGNYVRLGICQSKERHKPAIRALMAGVAGAEVKEFVTPARDRTFPMTGKTYRQLPQHWWYLPAAVSRSLLEKAGFRSRDDLPRIACQLDAPARESMLGAMMAAEGDARGHFANTDIHILETFQILCALEG